MTMIYGLRRAGDTEIRYVGRSNHPLPLRLRKHIQNAARNYPPKISAWIREARDIEIVPLMVCRAEAATAAERAAVERHHFLGHRLTNSHLLSPIIARARQDAAA